MDPSRTRDGDTGSTVRGSRYAIMQISLVGHLYDGVAQHLAIQFKACLKHLSTSFSPKFSSSMCITAFVRLRVKGLALGLDLLDAQPWQAAP